MLLIVWGEGSSERVTRDADLLGFGDNSPAGATATFREIYGVGVDDDGMHQLPDSGRLLKIRADELPRLALQPLTSEE